MHITVVSHLFGFVVHFTETDATVRPTLTTLSSDLRCCQFFDSLSFPCKNGMPASGHFADARSLTGYEPNLTSSQHMVAWEQKVHVFTERKLLVE